MHFLGQRVNCGSDVAWNVVRSVVLVWKSLCIKSVSLDSYWWVGSITTEVPLSARVITVIHKFSLYRFYHLCFQVCSVGGGFVFAMCLLGLLPIFCKCHFHWSVVN